ncbi:MAG: hypothetical protein WA733_12465 [Methylocystis sp.]
MSDEKLPIIETYRGVGIHDFQDAYRVERVVKPAIDLVHAENDILALAEYAGDVRNPPEARMFAAAKCRAAHEMASETRTERPRIDMQLLAARVAGLGSLKRADPSRYASIFEAEPPLSHDAPRAARRPLDHAEALEAAQKAAR